MKAAFVEGFDDEMMKKNGEEATELGGLELRISDLRVDRII